MNILLKLSCIYCQKYIQNLQNPPGKPIVLWIGNLTEIISSFVDHRIKDFVPALKSYIKDSTHFLLFLKELPPRDEDVLMCTLDIESLNTNIDHQQVLDTLEHYRNTRSTGARHVRGSEAGLDGIRVASSILPELESDHTKI